MLKAVLLCSMFISIFVFAHGEDKYGPNKGFIKMPGAFHTELVPSGKNKLKVYLLDLQWKNPSVLNSKLQIRYNDKIEATCEVKTNYYECVFPGSVNLSKKGELKVTAEREAQKGMEVSYALPLKLANATKEKQPEMNMDHSSHH